MRQRQRLGRSLFSAYLWSVAVAVLMAAPLVSALEPASAGASRPAERFRDADIDGDGFVSPAEAARLSGFSSVFAQADRNGDERLDAIEFRRALSLREGRR